MLTSFYWLESRLRVRVGDHIFQVTIKRVEKEIQSHDSVFVFKIFCYLKVLLAVYGHYIIKI